jgi:hypothetical protein
VRLCTEMQERNIFASTKANTVTCDLSCKRYVGDCAPLISSVDSVYVVQQPNSAQSRLTV